MVLILRGRGAYSAAVSYTQAAGTYDLVYDPDNPADSYVFVGSTATTGAALTDRRYWLPYGAAGTEAYEAIEQRFARGAEDTLPDRLDGMDETDEGADEEIGGLDERVEDLEAFETEAGGRLNDLEADNLILPTASLPDTEAELYEGLRVFDTTANVPLWCVTPGEQESDSLEVTSGAVTDSGNVTVSLNGVAVVVAVVGGTAHVASLTINEAATLGGSATVTLDGDDTLVTVEIGDAASVAAAIVSTFAEHADWTVEATGAVVTFTAKAKEAKAGAFAWDAGETGATSTLGITETTPGVDADDAAAVATKIRAAAFTGWTAGGTGAVVTFLKDAVGACEAPAFADTGITGAAGTFTRTNQGVTTVWMTGAGVADLPKTLLTTQGDLLYHNGTGPARLPKGATGQALHMNGNDPAWATPLLTLMNIKGAASETPSTGTHEATDTYFHSDVAPGEYAFWRCTQKGTCGTLNSGSTTGTTFAGSPNVVVNAITGLSVDNYVAISGVTGILKVVDLPGAVAATTTDAEAALGQKVIPVTATTGFSAGDVIVLDAAGTPEFATVASVEADVSLTVAENLTATHANGVTVANCIVVDTNADAAVSAAAVTYSAPVFKGFGVMEGA